MPKTQLRLPFAESEDFGVEQVAALREALLAELRSDEASTYPDLKMEIRARHLRQRAARWQRDFGSLRPRLDALLMDFADGDEVDPAAIDPFLVPVESGTHDADLFRLATLLWSVPVSAGYGRRMRFLVRDRSNGKLIGVFGLGDPVFNLSARDRWIGWTVEDRRERLVNVMDAFVVGAVPPYSVLIGGKLVFSLIASAEVGEAFTMRYGNAAGIISKRRKAPRLSLVTVTSALGRSSLYNRLRLTDPCDHSRQLVDLIPIGWTRGYGHFQVSETVFSGMRAMLAATGHAYASGHQYGDGPNWRMRVTRVAFTQLGLSTDLQRHGIERQVFALPLASNFREFLSGAAAEAVLARPSSAQIATAALDRWVRPRAARLPSFHAIRRAELKGHLLSDAVRLEGMR